MLLKHFLSRKNLGLSEIQLKFPTALFDPIMHDNHSIVMAILPVIKF